MATPTPEDILEIFEDLNYPSASKLRAALIKRGFRARLKDVASFCQIPDAHATLCKGAAIPGQYNSKSTQ